MTTPQGMLADKIRSGELELIFCHPDGKLPALSASQEQRDLVEAALRHQGRAIKLLEWEETFTDRGDGSKDQTGWEADSGFGSWYSIEMYFSSDSYGWQVKFDCDVIADCDDPERAKQAAQTDFERRVHSTALTRQAQEPPVCSGCRKPVSESECTIAWQKWWHHDCYMKAVDTRQAPQGREITFGYTNYRGETSYRRVRPISIRYGHSEYHNLVDDWLLLAFDLEKDAIREFAMRDMLLVEPRDALIPAVAPDGAGEASLRALVQELFDFTTPVSDAEKFLALSATMAESGWWKRAKAALALTPADGAGEAIPLADHDEIGRKVSNQPWEIQQAIVTIAAHCTALTDEFRYGKVADLAGCISQCCLELAAALAQAQQPGEDKR